MARLLPACQYETGQHEARGRVGWVVPSLSNDKKANLGAHTNCRHQVCDLGHSSLNFGFLLCKLGIKNNSYLLVVLRVE